MRATSEDAAQVTNSQADTLTLLRRKAIRKLSTDFRHEVVGQKCIVDTLHIFIEYIKYKWF
jgi:hypothetical protein